MKYAPHDYHERNLLIFALCCARGLVNNGIELIAPVVSGS